MGAERTKLIGRTVAAIVVVAIVVLASGLLRAEEEPTINR